MSDGKVSPQSRQLAGSVVHQSYHDPDSDVSLSTDILLALDELPQFDVENSDTVMFDHIDLDALDDLFSPTNDARAGEVTFTVEDYEVTATATGEITIRQRGPSAT